VLGVVVFLDLCSFVVFSELCSFVVFSEGVFSRCVWCGRRLGKPGGCLGANDKHVLPTETTSQQHLCTF